MSKKEKALLVVGTGAVGATLLVRLQNAGIKTVALTTMTSYEKIIQDGLKVKLSNNRYYIYEGEVYHQLPDDYNFNFVIVATKSYNNKDVAPLLKDRLSDESTILLFQNGMNIEKPFLTIDKDWTIVRAISSFGAFRENKTHVIERSVGRTKIGLIMGKKEFLNFWKRLLEEIGLPTMISDNLMLDIWLKLISNSVINPLTAIAGTPNRFILHDKKLKELAIELLKEVLLVIPPELGIDFNKAYEAVKETIMLTQENLSSMLQDIKNNRHTEIDELNGKILLMAEEKGLKLPYNRRIVNLIKGLERGDISPEVAILELRSLN